MSDTIIYDLDNPKISYPTVTSTHGISVTSNIYVVDGDNTSNRTMSARLRSVEWYVHGIDNDSGFLIQSAEYKAAGKTVMCYFSAGSFEPFR